jgi:hypothetical protein
VLIAELGRVGYDSADVRAIFVTMTRTLANHMQRPDLMAKRACATAVHDRRGYRRIMPLCL